MKVFHIEDDINTLPKEQQRKVALLKMVDNGRYIEGVGIRDNHFYLLTEEKSDEMFFEIRSNVPYIGYSLGSSEERLYTKKLTELLTKLKPYREKDLTKIKGVLWSPKP